MIPTAAELDAWLETLRQGYATKEMLPRVIDAYKRLLKVAEAARPCVEVQPAGTQIRDIYGDWVDGEGSYIVASGEYERLDELEQALDALETPMPETEGKR